MIDYNALRNKARDYVQRAKSDLQAAKARGDKAGERRANLLGWLASGDGEPGGGRDGMSRFATALGYDAIRIPSHGQVIILNRTALRISHQVRDE